MRERALKHDPDYYSARDLEAGAISGVIAGLIMFLVASVYTYVEGRGAWYLEKGFAALFQGRAAQFGGAGTILLGVGLLVAVSAILGIIFTLYVGARTRAGSAFVEGLVFGAVVWVVMTFVVVPVTDPILALRISTMPLTWLALHLIFGSCLSLAPILERKLEMVSPS